MEHSKSLRNRRIDVGRIACRGWKCHLVNKSWAATDQMLSHPLSSPLLVCYV